MYLLWWDKPLDFEEPTVLSGSMVREMCALMCMRSFPYWTAGGQELPYRVRYGSERTRNIVETFVRPDDDQAKTNWYRLKKVVVNTYYDFMRRNFGLELRQEPFTPLECRLEWAATSSADEQLEGLCQHTAYPVSLDYPDNVVGPKDQTTNPSAPATNRIGIDGLCLTIGTWQELKGDYVFVPRRSQPEYAPASVTLSKADIVRWRLCAHALQRYCPQPRWVLISGTPSHQDFPAYGSVYERSPNWPSSQHLEFTKGIKGQAFAIWLGFSFAGLVYGGLHLLAWNAPFPSHIEYKLWRSSGILLVSSGFICTLYFLAIAPFVMGHEWIVRTSSWQDIKTRLGHWYKPLARFMSNIGWMALGLSMFALAGAYLAARGYLVAESFSQLMHLPDSAYALPGWSEYYPHIT